MSADDLDQRFAQLVRANEAVLLAAARRLCRSHHDPNDLVQDALERAFKSYGRLPPGANERAWVLTILTNLFIDRARKRKSEPRSEQIDEGAVASPVRTDASVDAEPPEPWSTVTSEQLHGAIRQLSDKLQIVYRLHALEGRDYIYIAEKLQIPKATVGTRLLQARKKLRELLDAAPPASEVAT
jgi:RNA polymerase sigma-70 factor (ECF subfamily)